MNGNVEPPALGVTHVVQSSQPCGAVSGQEAPGRERAPTPQGTACRDRAVPPGEEVTGGSPSAQHLHFRNLISKATTTSPAERRPPAPNRTAGRRMRPRRRHRAAAWGRRRQAARFPPGLRGARGRFLPTGTAGASLAPLAAPSSQAQHLVPCPAPTARGLCSSWGPAALLAERMG